MSQRAIWWAVTVDCNEVRRVVDFWSAVLDCGVMEPGADRSECSAFSPLAQAVRS